jgi:hypothetical protein
MRFLMSDNQTVATQSVKREPIFAATLDLQFNLAEHVNEADL